MSYVAVVFWEMSLANPPMKNPNPMVIVDLLLGHISLLTDLFGADWQFPHH
jgi:hypothetical protein